MFFLNSRVGGWQCCTVLLQQGKHNPNLDSFQVFNKSISTGRLVRKQKREMWYIPTPPIQHYVFTPLLSTLTLVKTQQGDMGSFRLAT